MRELYRNKGKLKKNHGFRKSEVLVQTCSCEIMHIWIITINNYFSFGLEFGKHISLILVPLSSSHIHAHLSSSYPVFEVYTC